MQSMVGMLQADLAAARADAERASAAATEAQSEGEEAEARVADLQDRWGCEGLCMCGLDPGAGCSKF